MNFDSGDPAGTIWVSDSTTYEKQWQLGALLAEPYGVSHLSTFINFSLRNMNGLDDWGTLDKNGQYVCAVGLKYLF